MKEKIIRQTFFGMKKQIYGIMTEIPYTCSIKKETSFIIKHTVISLTILILLLIQVSAQDFQFTSPESVNINNSFSISIMASTQEVHDVKIFVQDSNRNIISEIFNTEWKNPFYYLKSAFPEQTEFKIRILEYADNSSICVRLRKSGARPFTEKCNEINILQISPSQELNNENNTTEDNNQNIIETTEQIPEEIKKPAEENNTNNNLEQKQIKNISYQNQQIENLNNEKIILNSKPVKKEIQTVYTTKYDKIKLGIIYSFIAFCIIIIILLAFKQL